MFASEADYHAYIDSLEAQNFNIYDTYITEYVSMDVSEAVSSDENPYLTPTALFSQGGKTETTATAAEPADAETETTTETTEAVAVPDDTCDHHRLYPYRARGEGRHLSGGVLHESASGKQAASDRRDRRFVRALPRALHLSSVRGGTQRGRGGHPSQLGG